MESFNEKQNIAVVPPQSGPPRRRHAARWLTVAVLVLALGTSSLLLILKDKQSASIAAASAAKVEIASTNFSPQTIKIKRGESVTWFNNDSAPHQPAASRTVSASDNSQSALTSDEPLASGESYTATFEQAGTFAYHDRLNPAVLTAVVIVD